MEAILAAIDFGNIETVLVAAGVAIVGITLVLKGPTIAKRIISKL